MCREIPTDRANDLNAARLYSLCPEHAVAHVMEIAGVQYPPSDEDGVIEEWGVSPDSVPDEGGPGKGLFGAFCTLAKTMLAEYHYFDLDYRSEIGELQEWSYAQMKPMSIRLHFFSLEADPEESYRDFLRRAGGAATTVSAKATSAADGDGKDDGLLVPRYLGYSVVRGTPGDPIGRSLVSPFSNIDDIIKLDYRVVHSQVRTAVTEHVNVLGVPLIAVGVPFMEQEGSLIRCAHVSAWICHYTATLRGFVPRRPISHFHRMGGTYAIGRSFPSQGLTTHEVVQILGRSDMPAEVLDGPILKRSRDLNWTDRKVLKQRLEKAKTPTRVNSERKDVTAAVETVWIKDNLSAAVCRYLNSGIPVMLLDGEHTQVVVGYVRRSDHEDGVNSLPDYRGDADVEEGHGRDLPDLLSRPTVGAAEQDEQSDVEYFIVSDDQRGPFELVAVQSLAEMIRARSAKVLVPLPRGLSLTGRKAEQLGIRFLNIYMRERLKPLLERVAAGDTDYSAEEAGVLRFYQDISRTMSEKYTVRTYATTGIDLKTSVDRRLRTTPDIADTIATQPMPKYVWVMEVIDRTRRRTRRRNSVRAMVVMDASRMPTKTMDDATLVNQVRPLFVHYPGTMSVNRPLEDNSTEDVDATMNAYSTGRWDHKQLIHGSAERVAVHSKGAVGTN